MSASFICSVLEFPHHHKTPDWDKAKEHIRKCSALDLAKCFNSSFELGLDEGDKEFVEDVMDHMNLDYNNPDSIINHCVKAVDECSEMWYGNDSGVSVKLFDSVVLISGESSWGDVPEGVGWMSVFVSSGGAAAAGFYE
jgi:hypothetical protein